jgi:hypothetical protein
MRRPLSWPGDNFQSTGFDLPRDSDFSLHFMWHREDKLHCSRRSPAAGLSVHASGRHYVVSVVEPSPSAARSSAAAFGVQRFPAHRLKSNGWRHNYVAFHCDCVGEPQQSHLLYACLCGFMRVYVDQLAVYFTFTNSIHTQIFVAPGQHKLEVMAEDNQGYISASILNINVTSQSQTTVSNIESMPGWQSCSALFPTGSGRDGQICAAGLGTAESTLTQNQSSPAMDGQSAKFSMGGPTPYSNMLYFNAIAGGDNVSRFTYDLYFYIDNPNASQALEFDINQTFGGKRWVWGSECNFNGSGKWDIWDDVNGWQPTIYDCKPFPANTWIHLVWNVERVGDQVHYISLTVGDQTYNIDTYYPNQPDWTLEEIDVAFQMDGNYKQEPYNVWLDKVQLTAN